MSRPQRTSAAGRARVATRLDVRRYGSGLQQGFSLLEMIAAILLLAVAFMALMQVLGSSARLTSQAAQRSQAALWARSLLDSSYVLEPIRAGTSEGRFDSDYRWHLEVSRATPSGGAMDNAPVQLYQCDLDVLWGKPPYQRSAHFSTLRASSPLNNNTQGAPL